MPMNAPQNRPDGARKRAFDSRRRLGRSAPRSRNGCTTCKARKVRCDETLPTCANCTRLGSECIYQTASRRAQRRSDPSTSAARQGPHLNDSSSADLVPMLTFGSGTNSPTYPINTLSFDFDAFSRSALDLWCSTAIALPDPPSGAILDLFPLESTEPGHYEANTPPAADSGQGHGTVTGYDIHPQLATYTPDHPRRSHGEEDGNDAAKSNTNESHLLRDIIPNFRRLATGIPFGPYSSVNGPDSVTRRAEALGIYFQECVFVPAVTPIDTPSWRSLCRQILAIARDSSIVSNAVVAVAQLHFVRFPSLADREALRNGHHLAQYLYAFAKEKLAIGLDRVKERPSKVVQLELLVALFLLSCFELIDKEDIHRAQQIRWADDLLETLDQTDSLAQQIISWLLLFDAKVVTLGGSGILPRSPVVLTPKTSTPMGPAIAVHFSPRPDCEGQAQLVTNPVSPPANRFVAESNSRKARDRLYNPPYIIKQSVLRDAVCFHHESEQFLRKIAMLDRHHRPRGSPQDEIEVTAIARQLVDDLHQLWGERPGILDLEIDDLRSLLHPDLATEVARLLCVFRACFFSHFCYLYRAAWWDHSMQADQQFAMDETWRSLRGSVDLSSEIDEETRLDGTTGDKVPILNSAVMWALFTFTTECLDSNKAAWCIAKLNQLGQVEGDFGPGGEHASINASRVARLLQEVVDQQTLKQSRVDVRFKSLELFGFMFPIL